MRRSTFKASKTGKEKIRQARIHRGWKTGSDEHPLRAASRIIDPATQWDQLEYFANNISPATWNSFLIAKKRITREAFIAYSQSLQLNWEEIVDMEEVEKPVAPTAPMEPERDRLIDYGDAPDLVELHGREQEIGEISGDLHQAVRLLAIYGQGGIGKTAFARSLLETVHHRFDCIIWRSLKQAPSLEELLRDIFKFLDPVQLDQEQPMAIATLITYFQSRRCLLVLDDWESILSSGRSPYLEGYQDYGQLLVRMVAEGLQSCLLLLSREKPIEVKTLAGDRTKSFKLAGLSIEAAKQILILKGLRGKEEYLENLGKAYSNPKVLQLVADEFMEALDGKIGEFADDVSILINDAIVVFLNQQIQRLTAPEEHVMYWLVIRRSTATIEQLQTDVRLTMSSSELMRTLSLLRGGRCLVELDEDDCYTLDSVVLKYLTIQLTDLLFSQLMHAIDSQEMIGNELFITHALVTPSEQDETLQTEQIRRLLKPIQTQLKFKLGGERSMREKLEQLQQLSLELRSPNYMAQNIAALMV